MGGGLMQLVAYGAQDVYLTGNPQITFWKVTYRRHTNFAMESIEQTFNGQADFGRRVQCTISRNGDLAYRTYLQVTLPEVNQSLNADAKGVYARWLDYPGEQLISMVEVEIGGQRIDRQYGDWMHIWNQLTLTSEQEAGYNKMIGQTLQLTYLVDPTFADVQSACGGDKVPDAVCAPRKALPETTLYIPLQFWFCRNPGLALPLIALQYHEVKINIEIRALDECLFAVESVDGPISNANSTNHKVSEAYALSLVAASLYVDYIFLDTDERRRMAQNPHEYLIEQLQFTGDESIGSSSNKIKLNFNHPCKELIYVVQPDANVNYCDMFESGKHLHMALGAQPFNYTDALDALPNTILAYAGQVSVNGGAADDDAKNQGFVKDGLFETATQGLGTKDKFDGTGGDTHLGADMGGVFGAGKALDGLGQGGAAAQVSGVTDAGAYVLAETALNMHCWGENPVVTCKLQLNGQDRFSEREGSYFDVVQPFQHHTRHPDTFFNFIYFQNFFFHFN